jgi:hypothetical protein
MRNRPILMNTEMAKSTHELIKTQTRRINGLDSVNKNPDNWECNMVSDKYGWVFVSKGGHTRTIPCPYGKVGDRLWVRETFASLQGGSYEDIRPREGYSIIRYKADDSLSGLDADTRGYPYRPSIHMPRWASRITLEITDIRVERVQDIDEMGALNEGTPIKYFEKVHGTYKESHRTTTGDFISGSAKDAFSRLWDSINAKRGYSWDSNPWVWVVSFKVIS